MTPWSLPRLPGRPRFGDTQATEQRLRRGCLAPAPRPHRSACEGVHEQLWAVCPTDPLQDSVQIPTQGDRKSRPILLSVWNKLFSVISMAAILTALLAVSPAGANANDEGTFVSGVNQARAAKGLPALTVDTQLISLARGWSNKMNAGVCGEGNNICHASPISAGVTHDWAKLGENVGTGPDVKSVMDAFIASPGHYANIIDPAFTHVGIGVVWDGARLYVTQRFMKLQPAATTTTTAAPPTTTIPVTQLGTDAPAPAPA
ncbi:MAG: CAP domain-containing protein, partial [Acidimicrobiales bacterium]